MCAKEWITTRIRGGRRVDRRVVWSATQIERSHGAVPIARLQHETGLSKKQIVRVFREQIGVTPKVYARLIRFRRALTLLHHGRRSAAEVALLAGYYDQPHMNLDFREFAALTPRTFLSARRHSATTLAG